MIEVPPCAINKSEAIPRAGFAVIPLLPSDPPQFVPRMILSAEIFTRLCWLTEGSNSAIALMPASTVFLMPPHS